MTDRYSIKGTHKFEMTREMLSLLDRRTRPFLDWAGISTRPVSMLLQEAYLQGMNDAIDALQSRDTTP